MPLRQRKKEKNESNEMMKEYDAIENRFQSARN